MAPESTTNSLNSPNFLGGGMPPNSPNQLATLFVEQHVKGAIIVDHVAPPHGKKVLRHRMIVRELRQ